MIQIKNLTKSYQKTVALSNLNLSVKDGSIFGLVGINGAGKSTLLRLMAGVFSADNGEVLYDNENIFENEKSKKDVFFLPDEPFYSSMMTGKKMAEFYKTFYDFDGSVFDKYRAIFKLDTTIPLRNYSKGMRRQLFVSIAFASNAKYLLLDEAFDGLDPSARLVFKRGLIDTLARTQGTAIIASHSLRELEDICDCYGLIDNKKIVESGNIIDSLEKLTKFQLAFNSPINKEDLGFEALSFEASGRIVKIVVSGDKDEYLAKVKALKPLIIDELPVDFEELFIGKIQQKEQR